MKQKITTALMAIFFGLFLIKCYQCYNLYNDYQRLKNVTEVVVANSDNSTIVKIAKEYLLYDNNQN